MGISLGSSQGYPYESKASADVCVGGSRYEHAGSKVMEIFDLLKEEHERIVGMLALMMSEKKKGEAFEQLRVQIEAHMEGEEEHVYPEIRAAGMKDEILESLEEHHIARIVLGELEDMSDREEAWMPKFKLLASMVERHLLAEEHAVFTAARKKIREPRG